MKASPLTLTALLLFCPGAISWLPPTPIRKGTALVKLSKEDIPAVFPQSTRAALIEKAKQLDDAIEDQGVGSYSASLWSNRLGTALTPISPEGIYTADRPFIWNKLDVGCRMTVIERKDSLWIHSPVGLDGPLMKSLERLGKPVGYVVSSNYEHVKFVAEWARAYPDAEFWACPGLMQRKPEVPWTGEIPYGYRPTQDPPLWDDIQALHVDTEAIPLLGTPFFNEVIFFHTKTGTMLTTDFYWNYPQGDGVPNSHLGGTAWELAPAVGRIPFGSQFWKFVMDKVYPPIYFGLLVSDRDKLQNDILNYVLNKWEVETVVPAHGDIIRGKELVKDVLRKFFSR